MAEVNLFELATRKKLRFQSQKGPLTTEQLWDLPLSSVNSVSLDAIAIATNKELKDTAEESFVSTASNPRRAELNLQLDILKHVINVKLAENEDKKKRASAQAELAVMREALHRQREQKIGEMTEAQILERMAELERLAS